MKGRYKRRSFGFKKGNKHNKQCPPVAPDDKCNRQIVRIEADQYQELTRRSTAAGNLNSNQVRTRSSDQDNQQMDFSVLRPRGSKSYLQRYMDKGESNNDYILVHRQKAAVFWNQVIKEHILQHPGCKGVVENDMSRSRKVGTVWEVAALCEHCNYKSPLMKLYEEVQTVNKNRGRKAAEPNIWLQVALSKNSIGNTAAREIFASMNIDPPSKSGLTKAANKVCDKIPEINRRDMHNIRSKIKEDNRMLGLPAGSLDAEVDGSYNHRTGTSSEITPTQSATQATYLVVENNSKEKKVINCRTYSRLCACDVQEKHGPHRKHCRSNLLANAVIGNEKLYLAESLKDLYEEEFNLGFLTLDGDSSARSLVNSLEQPDATTECQVLYCTRHLSRVFTKKVKEANFSDQMFPGRLKVEKTASQKLFALDIAKRTQAEFNCIFSQHGNSVLQMINKASFMPDAIIDCYRGQCSKTCWKSSLVCKKDKPWTRTYLKTTLEGQQAKAFINPNEDDIAKLRELLQLRFGRKAVLATQKNSTQNKCEAVNRGLTKSAPKCLTFKRNYDGRIHSAVHSVNNSPGASTVMLAEELAAPYPPKSAAVKALLKIDEERSYHQQLKKSPKAMTARKLRRERNFEICFKRNINNNNEQGYNKAAALLEDLSPPKQSKTDHSYNRPQLRRRLRGEFLGAKC